MKLRKEIFAEKIAELVMAWRSPVDFSDTAVMVFWYSQLQEMDEDVFVKECQYAIDTLHYFPTIAFFKQAHSRDNGINPDDYKDLVIVENNYAH